MNEPTPIEINAQHTELAQLRQALVEYFSEGELRQFTFDLGIAYDSLPGRGMAEKVVELLEYCQRRNRLPDLTNALLRERPFVSEKISLIDTQTEAPPPFKGLAYFDEMDADLFFGREVLTANLVTHLRDHSFLGVIGASGSGKSSLIRAGVLPVLRGEKQLMNQAELPPGSTQWPVHIISPTAHPIESLAINFTRDQESTRAVTNLMDDMLRDPRTLHLYVRKLVSSQPFKHLLLIVDQFEELFTVCLAEQERQLFIDNLMTAVSTQTDCPTKLIIALRADFYHRCGQYPSLRNALETRQKFIGQMSRDELKATIVQPASRSNLELENGLVDLLLDDTEDEPGALPLLSHALLETWKRRRNNTLTLAGYASTGRVQGAIAHTAETIYTNGLTADQQTIARHIFVRLTELGTETLDTRRIATRSDLILSPEVEAATEAVIQVLSDARLIIGQQDSIQVAHEALIREWPRLREWLTEDREELRLRQRLSNDVQEWEAGGWDSGHLYHGQRLELVRDWPQKMGHLLNPSERQFLIASADSQRQRLDEVEALLQAERKVSRLTRSILALTLVLMAIIGFALREPLLVGLKIDAATGPVVEMTAAEALLGSAINPSPLALPERAYQLETFAIEPYEVTNGRYLLCVESGPCTEPGGLPSEYQSEARKEYPVTRVTAIQAMQFCQWIGRTLPTDEQWERAARGTNGRKWPWEGDDPPTPEKANVNFDAENGTLQMVGLTPAGATPEGIYDLVGNVMEWTRSAYELDETGWNGLPDSPPVSLSVRGGSYVFSAVDITLRTPSEPTASEEFVGFRCVETR